MIGFKQYCLVQKKFCSVPFIGSLMDGYIEGAFGVIWKAELQSFSVNKEGRLS